MALSPKDIIITTIFTKDISYLGAFVLGFFRDFTERDFAILHIDLLNKSARDLIEEIPPLGKKLVIIIPKVEWTDEYRFVFDEEKYREFMEFAFLIENEFKKFYIVDTVKDETDFTDEDVKDDRAILKIVANKIQIKLDLVK